MSADQAHAHGADDHGHGHGHGSRFIQHHYDDAQHQFDSGKLGIWLFLAQEVLFFSALFVAYVLYRFHHPEIYGYAHKYLDVKYGAINTAVLIFSSLTAAWAVRAAQKRQQKLLVGCIFVTILCACAFLGIKYVEYNHKYHEQILFGPNFDPCVTAGNTPLLTKKNQCPGHTTSVYWDGKDALTGCFAEIEIDQDPKKPGLQLDCQVVEAELVPPKKVDKKDAKGEVVKNDKGEVQKVDEADRMNRPIFGTKSPTPIPKQCPPPSMHGHPDASALPCWLPSAQPAVCRVGYYYTESCSVEGTCAQDWTRKNGPDLIPAVSKRYDRLDDCNEQRVLRNRALTNAKKAAEEEAKKTGKPLGPPSGLAVSSACVRSGAVGFVVDHGDHDERRTLYPVVTCKPPAKPPAEGDIHDVVANRPKLGEKQIEATTAATHDAHEQMYLGPPPEHTGMFFTIYFAMTGLHGIHVLVGVVVFIWLLIRAIKGHFTPDYFGPVDFAALYWHIVDLIWIFLFPLLYLIH